MGEHLPGHAAENLASQVAGEVAVWVGDVPTDGHAFVPFATLDGQHEFIELLAVELFLRCRLCFGFLDVVPAGDDFFEDPIEPDNIDAMAAVAAELPMPVASGERLYTIYQFRELLNKNASAYIRPDISVAGGITNLKKIAAIAEASYVGMVPHNPCSPVMTASVAHLDAAIHNLAIQEYTGTEFEKPKSDLIKEPLKLVDGHLLLPDAPGLGIELNEEAFASYPPVPHNRIPVVASDGALRDY